ncbi:apoptosis facilitator Bcl-2-like protein 14 [Echeneis naucrates]|uniref:Apoptosis facilitator Bcl-2-like protein 14 n=1 Tax=Echeneis naucrates TaxID=173247 RepID=A0A665VQ91_ECHNA|nr:apoptosis facilitator Bcl-2-like protein 14 [Echeneis naucrates]XP_029350622.1 apoptosis facilitator Bcl-2-like protein 14 [Echeneis naucrates]
MANGHIEIYDPISTQKDGDDTPTSDTASMDDTVELRILMAYATRKRSKKEPESPTEDTTLVPNGYTDANGTAPPQTPAACEKDVTQKRKKKRKVWKRLRGILACVKPETEADVLQNPDMLDDQYKRCIPFKDDKPEDEDKMDDVARRLMAIASEISFAPPDIEADSQEDDVERVIGLLLREAGDQLNEKELKDMSIARELFWNYSFFSRLISGLLTRMGLRSPNPDSPGPHASPKTQIAVMCEATSRLSGMNRMPSSRLLGYGARYLNEYYSSWVKEQGGYEAAFESDDEDDQH